MKIYRKSITTTLLGVVLALAACGPTTKTANTSSAMDHSSMPAAMPGKPASMAATKTEFKVYKPYPYPFDTCIVCGMKLDKDAITFVQGDYEIKVCSQGDADVFRKDPAKYLAQLQQAYQDARPNPLKTCVVCGMDIDAGFLPFVYEGRQFQVCDQDCLAEFKKDPAKYVKIWDDAAQATTQSK